MPSGYVRTQVGLSSMPGKSRARSDRYARSGRPTSSATVTVSWGAPPGGADAGGQLAHGDPERPRQSRQHPRAPRPAEVARSRHQVVARAADDDGAPPAVGDRPSGRRLPHDAQREGEPAEQRDAPRRAGPEDGAETPAEATAARTLRPHRGVGERPGTRRAGRGRVVEGMRRRRRAMRRRSQAAVKNPLRGAEAASSPSPGSRRRSLAARARCPNAYRRGQAATMGYGRVGPPPPGWISKWTCGEVPWASPESPT